jgi:NADH-quinone oxidoreductase subunit A
MTSLVITLLVFVVVGASLLAANLVLGWLVRPNRPAHQKGLAYECGEEPVGSAWVQFDLRFYVVALLFIIFDVELAFFFPWAVAFGTSNRLADETQAPEQRLVLTQQLAPTATVPLTTNEATSFARFAFLEMLVFFAILLVGFAYIWNRGDLEWVTSLAGQTPPTNENARQT